jgi:hypothetical protein
MHPFQRLGAAQDVAEMGAFLGSDAAAFCTGGYDLVAGACTAHRGDTPFRSRPGVVFAFDAAVTPAPPESPPEVGGIMKENRLRRPAALAASLALVLAVSACDTDDDNNTDTTSDLGGVTTTVADLATTTTAAG